MDCPGIGKRKRIGKVPGEELAESGLEGLSFFSERETRAGQEKDVSLERTVT